MHRVLEHALRGQVLTEGAPRELNAGDFLVPERVMLRRVGIDRLVRSTVNRQIGLLVALDVQPRDANAARDGCLEDRCTDGLASPLHFAWQSDVDRQNCHWRAAPTGRE